MDKINKNLFENLCGIWCTLVEIADAFDVSEDTIESWCKKTYNMTFSEIYKKKSSKGKISLRRMQFKSAEKGNVTMQIWLGKQQLGQKENFELEHSVNNGLLDNLLGAMKDEKARRNVESETD